MASGSPTELEVQDQWRKVIGIIDTTRAYADGLCGTTNAFDLLTKALEGDISPAGLINWAENYRAGLSSLVSPGQMLDAITPCILEYAKVLQAAGALGSGYEELIDIKGAIYKHFIDSLKYVESRELTFDTSSTVTGTGNGDIARMTVDENDFDLENCHTEKKVFRCRLDKNSGANEYGEEFEMVAETRSKDDLEANSFGSGVTTSATIRNRNAGSGATGSLLRNSTFSEYDAAAANHFAGWVLASGTVPIQDLITSYLPNPTGAALIANASVKASADFKLSQSLTLMRTTRLDTVRPYFLRAMVNATAGTAVGGDFILTLGSTSVTVSVATISGSGGWYEVLIPMDKDAWFKNFNQEDLSVSIEWATRTSGDLYIDDLIFVGMTAIDGTHWTMRHTNATPVSWLLHDEIEFTDSQSDTTKGKINYYMWRAGLGYLPHSNGTPAITFADP